VFFLYVPLAEGAVYLLLLAVPALATLAVPISGNTIWRFGIVALALSAVLFVGGLLVGLFTVSVVPRALNVFIEPGTVSTTGSTG
jgi:hypothetical protein